MNERRTRNTHRTLLDEINSIPVLETVDAHAIPVLQKDAVEHEILSAVGRIDHQDALTVPFVFLGMGVAVYAIHHHVLGRDIDNEPVDISGRAHGDVISWAKNRDFAVDLNADAALENFETLCLVYMKVRRRAPVCTTLVFLVKRLVNLHNLECRPSWWFQKVCRDFAVKSG